MSSWQSHELAALRYVAEGFRCVDSARVLECVCEVPWSCTRFGVLGGRNLDMHGNHLDGTIPSTIGNLVNLQYVVSCDMRTDKT